MSRYISVEWLEENAKLYSLGYYDSDEYAVPFELIGSAPSIDIVRCRECKYKSLYDGETKYYYCALEDRPNRQWSVDDWNYCCWGERKENE